MSILYALLGLLAVVMILCVGLWLGLHYFQDRLQTELKQRDEMVARAAAAQAKPPEVRCHTVLLDGVSQSGKTTFMARLACPTMGEEQLKKIVKTRRQALTHEVPLCWERGADDVSSPVLHALRFFDVAGEHPDNVINAIDELADDHGKDDQRRVVALWVWDLNDRPANRDRINQQLLKALYRNNKAMGLVKNIVVFLNKADKVAEKGDASLETIVAEDEGYIRNVLDQVGSGHKVEFHHGSALNGRGLHDAFGSIVRFLELGQHYPALQGVDPSA
jgi:hypothetical protein